MYRVKLTDFEGPLDLLLFFIKRDELDITNIPISRITQEFLEYLHLMATLDLEVAGDFIVMAATLMQIKVRMLLPRDENAPDEEDPRAGGSGLFVLTHLSRLRALPAPERVVWTSFANSLPSGSLRLTALRADSSSRSAEAVRPRQTRRNR